MFVVVSILTHGDISTYIVFPATRFLSSDWYVAVVQDGRR